MKKLAAVAILVILVTACATKQEQAKTEGTGMGAAAGAVVGALAGWLIGGDAEDAAIGAGVGALLGAAAGYSYADKLAKHHQELEGKENDLDARLDFARSVNEETKSYNAKLEEQIESLEPEIYLLAARAERNELTQQELLKEKEALGDKVKEAEESLALGQNDLSDLKRFRSRQGSSTELDDEIAKLEASLARLKRNTTALAALDQRI